MQSVDGDVRLSVRLSTADLNNDLKKMESAIKAAMSSIEKSVSNVGKDLSSAFSQSISDKSLEEINNSLNNLKDNVQVIVNKLNETSSTVGFEGAKDGAAQATAEIENATNAAKEFDKAQEGAMNGGKVSPSTGFDDVGKESEEASDKTEEFANKTNNIFKRIFQQLREGWHNMWHPEPIQETEVEIDNADAKFIKLQNDVQNAANKLEAAEAALARFPEGDSKFKKLQDDIQNAADKLDIAKSKLEDFKNAEIQKSPEFQEIQTQIKETQSDLETLNETKKMWQSIGISETDSSFQDLQQQIQNTVTYLEELRTKQQELFSGQKLDLQISGDTKFKALTDNVNSAARAYETAKMKAQEYSTTQQQTLSNAVSTASNQYTLATQRLQEYENAQSTAETTTKQTAQSIFSIGSPLNAVSSGFKTAGKSALSFYKIVGKTLLKGLKSAGNAIKKLFSNTKSLNSGFKSGFKTLLRYGLGIRGVYALFNKLRNAITEGFKNLVQYDDELNDDVSALLTQTFTLKNALAAAFDPILKIAIPALTQLARGLNRATNALAQFIASMSGQDTYIRAVEIQQDYAASLRNSADAAKDAKKATTQYLSGLDEIRTFTPTKDDSDSAGATGTPTIDPSQMFETVPIENKFKEFAQKIRALVESEDWEGLGKTIADRLNAGISNIRATISWDNVGEDITNKVTAITETINSLVSNIDWTNLGETIGEGINTVSNTLDLLLTGIDWQGIGSAIAESLNGIFDEVDWEGLGETIGHGLMALPNIIAGFVTNLDWAAVGTSLGRTLNGIVSSIDLGTLGSTLGTTITGIFTAAINFSKTFDWTSLGDSISDGFNEFLYSFDGLTVGEGINEFLQGIFTALDEAIIGIDWKEFWSDLVGILVGAFGDESLFTKIGTCALDLISGLWWGLEQNFEEFDWGLFGETIMEQFEEIFAPAIDLGTDLIESIVNGVKSGMQKVKDIMKKIKTAITGTNGWAGIKTKTSMIWSSIITYIRSLWDKIKKAISDKVTAIKTKVVDVWNSIKDKTSEIWNGLIDIIKGAINGVLGFINGLISGIVDGFNNCFDALNSLSFEVPDWVPEIGGNTFGFSIPSLTAPQIPLLAKGAVIPPNNAFMAILGDQKTGTNIETPEKLLRQIIREELSNITTGGTYQFTANINRRTLFDEIITEAKLRRSQKGRNPFESI